MSIGEMERLHKNLDNAEGNPWRERKVEKERKKVKIGKRK